MDLNIPLDPNKSSGKESNDKIRCCDNDCVKVNKYCYKCLKCDKIFSLHDPFNVFKIIYGMSTLTYSS